MSLTLLGSALALPTAGDGEGFHAPSPQEFYWPIFGSGDWTFTRPMATFAISILILSVALVALTKKAAIVPSKGQWLVEQAYDFVRNGIGRDTIGSKDFLRFTPLLFSLFMCILLNNLFGIIPPIQYPTMSRIGFPIALTLIVYVVYHIAGIRKKGPVRYLSEMIPRGLPKPIYLLIIPLEYATYFIIRPLTLALRLFGNMFAGHMLLLLFIMGGEYMLIHGGIGLKITSIGSFLMALVFTAFETLIEFLQAYIFTLLAATYISDAIHSEH